MAATNRNNGVWIFLTSLHAASVSLFVRPVFNKVIRPPAAAVSGACHASDRRTCAATAEGCP